jgi:anti-sigma B factor antagonist
MGFSMSTRKIGGVVIVDMAGRLTEGDPTTRLTGTIRRLIAEDESRFVLNLGGVSYISSGGLTAFTVIRNWTDEHRVRASLLHLTKRVRQVLQITHLVTVFESFDDEEEVVSVKWWKKVSPSPAPMVKQEP